MKEFSEMCVSKTNGFRLFPASIARYLSNKEAYTYLVLLFKSDFNTGESNVLLETLSNETGYNAETVSKHLHKAEKFGYVNITPRQYGKNGSGTPKTKNYYKIKKQSKDFVIVSRDFLDYHIENTSLKEETDIKGFILLVKCLCLNNCNFTYYSLRDMDKHLKISYATIQKLVKRCEELELIVKDKGCYKIKLDCFGLGNTAYFPKNTPALYKDIYNNIAQFCLSKGFEAPPYDRKYIAKIAAKYALTKKEISEIYKQTKEKDFVKRNYIPYILQQRLQDLDEPINSLNYFVQVLCGKKYEKDSKREPYEYHL